MSAKNVCQIPGTMYFDGYKTNAVEALCLWLHRMCSHCRYVMHLINNCTTPTQPQPQPHPYPNPTLTLAFWLGVSYYALSRLPSLSTRRLAIYSKTSITRLILTLTLPTPQFKVTEHQKLNLNLNLNLNVYILCLF